MRLSRKVTLFIAAIVYCLCIGLSSCSSSSNKENPLAGTVWSGKVVRDMDSQVLSKVAVVFKGDSMRIYSNAIFGSDMDRFVWLKEEEVTTENTSDIAMVFRGISPNNEDVVVQVRTDVNKEKLFISYYYLSGGMYKQDYYTITATQDKDSAKAFISKEYNNKRVPYAASNYLFGKKIGHILRDEDDLPIGTIYLDCHDETIQVQANALFSDLTFKKYDYDEMNSCFKYTSAGINDDIIIYYDSHEGKYVLKGFGCHSLLQETNLEDIHLSLGIKQSDDNFDYPTIETVYSGKIESPSNIAAQAIMMFLGVMYDTYWNVMFHDNNTATIIVSEKTNDDYTRLYSSLTGFSYLLGKLVNAGIESQENRYEFSYYVSQYDGIILTGNVDGKEKTLVLRTDGGSQRLIYHVDKGEECILQRIIK